MKLKQVPLLSAAKVPICFLLLAAILSGCIGFPQKNLDLQLPEFPRYVTVEMPAELIAADAARQETTDPEEHRKISENYHTMYNAYIDELLSSRKDYIEHIAFKFFDTSAVPEGTEMYQKLEKMCLNSGYILSGDDLFYEEQKCGTRCRFFSLKEDVILVYREFCPTEDETVYTDTLLWHCLTGPLPEEICDGLGGAFDGMGPYEYYLRRWENRGG